MPDICRLLGSEVPLVDGGGAHGIPGELGRSGGRRSAERRAGSIRSLLWGRYAVVKTAAKAGGACNGLSDGAPLAATGGGEGHGSFARQHWPLMLGAGPCEAAVCQCVTEAGRGGEGVESRKLGRARKD